MAYPHPIELAPDLRRKVLPYSRLLDFENAVAEFCEREVPQLSADWDL
jgi:hypothetical protein